jgi:hypothetical protein
MYGEITNAYEILVGKPEGKRPLGRPWGKLEETIKMDIGEHDVDTQQRREEPEVKLQLCTHEELKNTT